MAFYTRSSDIPDLDLDGGDNPNWYDTDTDSSTSYYLDPEKNRPTTSDSRQVPSKLSLPKLPPSRPIPPKSIAWANYESNNNDNCSTAPYRATPTLSPHAWSERNYSPFSPSPSPSPLEDEEGGDSDTDMFSCDSGGETMVNLEELIDEVAIGYSLVRFSAEAEEKDLFSVGELFDSNTEPVGPKFFNLSEDDELVEILDEDLEWWLRPDPDALLENQMFMRVMQKKKAEKGNIRHWGQWEGGFRGFCWLRFGM